jgi:hypothetical protein
MEKIDTDVAKLVSMIEEGELQLPEMQRRYVWPATRVRDLLDSLYRGYPSGAILVWETDREMPSRNLAVEQGRSPFKGHKLLLDGQQRLTSLTAVLRGKPVTVRDRKRPIDILFNLAHPAGPPVEVIEVDDDPADSDLEGIEQDGDEEGQNLQERLNQRTFVVSSSALLADPRWVRVSDVFNGANSDAQFLKPLVMSFDDPAFDKYSKRLQALRKIREYPYVMHVLDKSLSYEEVAEIFVRVNSLGMKLRGSDLALAQITSRWQHSLKMLEDFQEECEQSCYTLDLGILVRALVVFATGQSRFKTVGTTQITELKRGWQEAKEGLRFAINFLRTNAGIENEKLLSSPLFVIAVAYYGSQKLFKLTSPEASALLSWVYIASARGHYSGSSETTLDSDLGIIRNKEDLKAAAELQLGRLSVDATDLVGKSKRSALFPMAYLALKAKGAKDWRSQLELSLSYQGRDHSIEYHHIFPKKSLKEAGYEADQINEIANMAFIAGGTNRSLSSKPASDYLQEVLQTSGKEALEAHCIPTDSALWEVEAYPAFLEYRRVALASAINDFISINRPVEQPLDISGMMANGEGESLEFKSSTRWDYRAGSINKGLESVIVKSTAGILNAKGGVLLIGVDDKGVAIGLQQDYGTLSTRPNRDGYEQLLRNLFSVSFGKDVSASLSISFQEIAGQDICIVQIPRSSKPVYVADGSRERLFLRIGNTTQELNTRESVAYVKGRWPK